MALLVLAMGCNREQEPSVAAEAAAPPVESVAVEAPMERAVVEAAAETSFGWPLPEGVEPLRHTEEAHTWHWEGERADLMAFYAEHVPSATRMDVDEGVRFRAAGEDPSALYALRTTRDVTLWRIVVFRDDRLPARDESTVASLEEEEAPEDFRIHWVEDSPPVATDRARPRAAQRQREGDRSRRPASAGANRVHEPVDRPSRLPTSSAPAIPGGAFYPPGSGAAGVDTPRVQNRLGARRPDGAPVRFFVPTNPQAGF